MYIRAAVSLLVALLAACTTMADLQKPTSEKYFVLTKDHVREATHGMMGTKYVEGLRAGTYTLVAEDRQGLFFAGQGDCVLLLSEERREKYLQTGEVTPFEIRNAQQLTFAGGTGGLWLPKAGVTREPQLFWTIRNTTSGSYAGLTGMAIVSATEGSLARMNYGDQKEFLSGIQVLSGTGPQQTCGTPAT